MIGNVALDVVIGLLFIYLLYSLYATVIMEIISSTFGLRARNLNYALRRMLMDERSYEKHKLKLVVDANNLAEKGIKVDKGIKIEKEINLWFLEYLFLIPSRIFTSLLQVTGKTINLKNPGLYNRFFAQPSIKYLCEGGINNKPSYISPENFSKALIDAVKIDDPDLSVLASIQLGLEDETLLPKDSETKHELQELLREANNDLAKFNLLLERWFNDTMERSIGWFKRSVQFLLVAIGFVLVISFNVDTIAIIKKLSKDKYAREQMVTVASDFLNKNSGALETLHSQKDPDSLAAAVDKSIDSLRSISMSLQTDMKDAQNILTSNWNIPDSIHFSPIPFDKKKKLHKDSTIVSYPASGNIKIYALLHKSIDRKIFRKALPKDLSNTDQWLPVRTAYYKARYVLNLDNIWGYLLTVLALSMGSPFWFDLLSKLVKLRTSQSIPTDSDQGRTGTGNSSTTDKATLKRAG